MKRKEKTYKSKEEAFQNLLKKERSKVYKSQAKAQLERLRSGSPSSALLNQQIQRQQAQQRQRQIGVMGNRAEQIEIQMVNLDEVPLLFSMERERTQKTMVSNRYLENVEKSVTDSFPS